MAHSHSMTNLIRTVVVLHRTAERLIRAQFGRICPLIRGFGMTQVIRETAGRGFNHSQVSVRVRSKWLETG